MRRGLALAVCGLLLAGCLRQRLIIRSEPAGADILLNDQKLGKTPYDGAFLWYGWYRLTLAKDGYEQLDDRVLIESPPHLWIPLDLIMELMPFPVHDTRVLAYRLVPLTPLPEPSPPVIEPAASQPSQSNEGGHP